MRCQRWVLLAASILAAFSCAGHRSVASPRSVQRESVSLRLSGGYRTLSAWRL